MDNLAQKLIQLRKSKNITQKELAKSFNVSNKLISKWECGRAIPDIYYLKLYSKFFGVTIDNLVDNKLDLGLAIDYSKIKPNKKSNKKKYTEIALVNFFVYILLLTVVLVSTVFDGVLWWESLIITFLPFIIQTPIIIGSIQRIKEIKGGVENDSSKY